ncbi:c-type cytochrome [Bradyrhizobium sp. URHD0069]|uniref:c-type cytochrome n=1 Tax=Bradyrhizobium sp. URHD0069 TaxID=1380355 RepID=UPI0004966A67|nr:cytochrome c [Bradyrhizobium sp. URHD0069]
MFTRKNLLKSATLLVSVLMSSAAFAQGAPAHFGFGTAVTPQDLAGYFSIPPDGRGLPPGSGNAAAGAKVFAESCAACHGDKLQGNPTAGIGGDRLLGGRGSLATKTPVKTVESYWPYATTLFDYVKRSMPFSAPGSLKDDEIYAVVAYILSEAKVIKPTDVMDAKTLPKVVMPNHDGFIPDARPELSLYR